MIESQFLKDLRSNMDKLESKLSDEPEDKRSSKVIDLDLFILAAGYLRCVHQDPKFLILAVIYFILRFCFLIAGSKYRDWIFPVLQIRAWLSIVPKNLAS